MPTLPCACSVLSWGLIVRPGAEGMPGRWNLAAKELFCYSIATVPRLVHGWLKLAWKVLASCQMAA
eukprot:3031624-Lingulodinium_polyedra.AAC.1